MEVSIVDSTQQLKWEVTKEEFDNCVYPQSFKSPEVNVTIGNKKSKWIMRMYPQGYKDETKNNVYVVLEMLPGNMKYTVEFIMQIRGPNGSSFFPEPVEKLYANTINPAGYGKSFVSVFDGNGTWNNRATMVPFGPTENVNGLFEKFKNKIKVVATLIIYVEGKDYIHHKETSRNFMANHRSISELGMFSDLTIICGNKEFKSHRVLLASMSKIFKTMLTNEMFLESQEKSVKIDDSSPDIVEAMLFFMSNGVIPRDIHAKAFGLLYLADKYELQDLLKACEKSLVDNMTVENVIETLIIIDLHIPKSENRQKIIDFMKSNATEVTEVKDWIKFVLKYPNLVTEVVRSFAPKTLSG